MHRLIRYAAILSLLLAIVITACSDEETTGGITSDRCPDTECVECDSDADCDGGTYCDDVDGESVCVLTECEPNSSVCDGSSVVRCNAQGSGYDEPQACDTGICSGGECVCEGEADCNPGEQCVDGSCACDSGVYCGTSGTCCEEGEACASTDICDEDGSCETVSFCQEVCQGTVCGAEGELCCEGSTPICGPTGQCAPDCSDHGDLCGDDFSGCCPTGDVCIFGGCRTPGEPCDDFTDCDFGEYCDHGLGRCMPDDFPDDLVCEMDYEFEEFESEILWHWDGVEVGGSLHVNVAMTPVVADMTGNGIPDVAVNAYPTGSDSAHMPVVIDGSTGETIYYNDTRWSRRWGQLALADVTGNGRPEIITGNSSGVGVIKDIVTCPDPDDDDDGCYLWWNTDASMTGESQVVADITADGNPEILVNDTVLNAVTGEIIAQSGSRGYDYTVVADVTGDGKMEILSAARLLRINTADGTLEEMWTNSSLPGNGMRFAAVGDVASADDRDGKPEFVITGNSNVYVVAADTGELLHQFPVPSGGNGGPPIIADFDGDGSAEFGIAGNGCYTVFDLDCLGPEDEDLPGCTRPQLESCEPGVDCFGSQICPDLEDVGGSGDGILWSIYIQDISSSRTGSSVFDFLGDGRNEVVYNDECLLMVFDGQTGEHLFRYPNTTRTASEYPIVVDVNGDRRTNFVVAANNDRFSRDCETPIQNRPDRFPECHGPDPAPDWCTQGTTGVFALQDPEDRWVRTRQIWNQFAYHIDNINDDATVPTSPVMPWETHNTFRANRQGEIPLNAADVAIRSVQVNALSCPPDVEFLISIENEGAAAIPEGLPVTIYDVDTDEALVTVLLDQAIPPGGIATVEASYPVPSQQFNSDLNFLVVANDDGQGASPIHDCNPDKASALLDPVHCTIQL